MKEKEQVIDIEIDKLIPYENNPRINDDAVKYVAQSIKDYGFKVPLVVDANMVVICGHTRLEASKMLGLRKVPCLVADELTEDQVRAFRLVDNKTHELSSWDFDKLQAELEKVGDIDMTVFHFFKFDNEPAEDEEELEHNAADNNPLSKQKICTCPKCGRQFEI